ncbi:MAG TPA: hypothetical protein VGQ02_07430 [Candidatus Limnocylindrales bacterium]|nr:hypothetical protein [Candidatus Limnocylindrales bacterium]
MRRMVMLIAISTVLLCGAPAGAKEDGFGKVLDVLSGVLGRGDQQLRGHVVHIRDTAVVMRAEDGQTYVVDATQIDSRKLESLTVGQGITVVGKPGSKSFTLMASDIRRDERGQASKPLKKVHGVVQSVSGSNVTFRTDEGRLLSVDAAQIKGPQLQVKSGDAMTLVYEDTAQRKVLARWLEPDQATALVVDPSEQVSFHGHVLNVTDAALVVRADDGWTHVVDVSRLPADARRFELGEGVTLTATPSDNVLIASQVLRDRSDPARKGQAAKRLQTLHGTVQSVGGSTMTFRTDDGRLVPVDLSQMKGHVPKPRGGDPVTLVYEAGTRGKVAAMWIQADPVQPAAAVPSARFERLHGQVDSIDGSKFWLKTDDDRWFLVDAAQVDAATRNSVRAGRGVTVVGKVTDATTNLLSADWIRID